jgi:predicted peroxiredoxin
MDRRLREIKLSTGWHKARPLKHLTQIKSGARRRGPGRLGRRVDTPGGLPYLASVSLRGKKLGILLSTRPDHASFRHGLRLAEAGLAQGVDVYLYCIDEAVWGVEDTALQELRAKGLKLYACAYGAEKRRLPRSDQAVFAGLTVVSDLISGTDRFVSFN